MFYERLHLGTNIRGCRLLGVFLGEEVGHEEDKLTNVREIPEAPQPEDIGVGNERVAQLGVIGTTNQQLNIKFFTHGVDEHGRGDITNRYPGHVTVFDNT